MHTKFVCEHDGKWATNMVKNMYDPALYSINSCNAIQRWVDGGQANYGSNLNIFTFYFVFFFY